MMLNFRDLATRRQDRRAQVALPPRRIVAGAIAAHRRPVEYCLDPAAHPARGLRLALPYRLNAPENEAGVDRRDRQSTEDREGKNSGDRREELRAELRGCATCAHGDRNTAARHPRMLSPSPHRARVWCGDHHPASTMRAGKEHTARMRWGDVPIAHCSFPVSRLSQPHLPPRSSMELQRIFVRRTMFVHRE